MGSTTGYPPPRSGYDELDTTLMPPRGVGEYGRGSPGSKSYKLLLSCVFKTSNFDDLGPINPGGIASGFHGAPDDDGKSSQDILGFFLHKNNILSLFILV